MSADGGVYHSNANIASRYEYECDENHTHEKWRTSNSEQPHKHYLNMPNNAAETTVVMGVLPAAEPKSCMDSTGQHGLDYPTPRKRRCPCSRLCGSKKVSATATVPLDTYPTAEHSSDAFEKIDAKTHEHTCKLQVIQSCLKSNAYHITASLATIVSLLAFDFTIAFLDTSVDPFTLAIVGIVFAFFLIELVLVAITTPKYVCTFFCLLDIVGALSLIPDMLELMDGMGMFETYQNSNAGSVNIAGNNAGKVGRVARAGTTMRLARYARIFRIVRLVRVTRLFRVCMTDGVHDFESKISKPSNVGRLLAQKVTKRIVALIIAMILVLPYLEATPTSGETSMQMNLESMSHIKPVDSSEFNMTANRFIQSMEDIDQPFLYLRISGRTIVETTADETTHLRYTDTQSTCVPKCVDGISEISDYDTIAQTDISEGIKVQAKHSMVLCLFVILAFVGASTAVSQDAQKIVIKPIERMTKIVKKLASTVQILTENHERDKNGWVSENDTRGKGESTATSNQLGSSLTDSAFASENEAEVLEKVMKQMTDVLDNHHVRASRGKTRFSILYNQGRSSLLGMKTSVHKAWKSRSSFSSQTGEDSVRSWSSTGTTMTSGKISFNQSSRLSYMGVPRDKRLHKELHSLTCVLRSRRASYYLKQFMAKTFTLENFLFYEEVEKLRAMRVALRQRIYNRFIDVNASNSINIDSQTRNRVTLLLNENVDIPTIFDDAQQVILQLMELNTFQQFLTSSACETFVQEKEHQINDDPVGGA